MNSSVIPDSYTVTSASDIRNAVSGGYIERVLPQDLPTFPDHLARYSFAMHWAPGRNVLDLCCGTGYGSRILFAGGAESVLGIDIDEKSVAFAQRAHPAPRLTFQCADVMTPLRITPVDLSICFEGIEHVVSPVTLVRNIASSLTPEGIAFISTPNASYYPNGHSGNPFHVKEFTLGEFRSLLSQCFQQTTMYFQWNISDPYDRTWSFGNVIRSLLPLRVKRAFRCLRRKTGEISTASAAVANPILWRPYPLTYLDQPGLRGAQPLIWIAMCERPVDPSTVRDPLTK